MVSVCCRGYRVLIGHSAISVLDMPVPRQAGLAVADKAEQFCNLERRPLELVKGGLVTARPGC